MLLWEAFCNRWLVATFGILLFIFGAVVLFWNEGRAVHTIMSLDEALDEAVSINPTDHLEHNYNGRIVHMAGPIIIGEPLTEPDYNIQVLAVKLRRRVQMYQWVEETVENNYGESVASVQSEGRTYYYTMEWRDKLIDSRRFYIETGHHNPERFPIESVTQIADAVYIGKYELGPHVKEKFSNYVELTSDQRPEDASIKLHLGIYYHSNDVFNPEIGDVRLLFSFSGMEGEMYTIVGKLENNKIVPYKTSRGLDVLLVYSGELNLSEVFKQEHHAQRLTTWGFRFMGWVLVFFGATCTSTLLHIILMRVQFLSALAPDPHYPVGANVVLSLSMALIIASIAWVLHRPMIGAGLLFAAASPFVWCARGVANYEPVN
ncbi:transmembrane protein 43 homolog [Teleopsis dalmanni]|uniref:transmembrane protein 43 homolog n=1 Tax=Teleopsis dalmanni TaxID=139649 RepID=UPI0018CD6321|nr:transmembrane protein 43 homolog [Teleopsis dalmanni]XP_037939746.1 transmembrane protein 43 homolog [Teleopsis dalmanni]